MSFWKKLFGSPAPKTCCGGPCCAHSGNIKTAMSLTDEDMAKLDSIDGRVIIGKVLEVTAHPDPEVTKVHVTKTDLGQGTVEQILCGGTNLKAGFIVAVATVGAKLPGNFEIGLRAIRGVESHGMICARGELGLSLAGEKKGEIWPLPSTLSKFVGKPLRDL